MYTGYVFCNNCQWPTNEGSGCLLQNTSGKNINMNWEGCWHLLISLHAVCVNTVSLKIITALSTVKYSGSDPETTHTRGQLGGLGMLVCSFNCVTSCQHDPAVSLTSLWPHMPGSRHCCIPAIWQRPDYIIESVPDKPVTDVMTNVQSSTLWRLTRNEGWRQFVYHGC